MKESKLTTGKIALLNLLKHKNQTIVTMILIAIFSFAVFGGNIFIGSLENGLENARQRLGADLIVVPKGADEEISEILLQGKSEYFYMDAKIAEKMKNMEGIKNVTSQYYFASASSECCDAVVEIIGFDPESDFIIKPWIEQKIKKQVSDGEVVIGSGISLQDGHTMKLYGETYEVAAIMDKTGTGMDQSVFANTNTISMIRKSAMEKGFCFLSGDEKDMQNQVSAIMIKVEDRADAGKIARQIKKDFPDVDVMKSNSILAATSMTLKSLSGFYQIFLGLLFMMTILTLTIVFILDADKRKKEFALLRMIGMTKRSVAFMFIKESFVQGLLGSVWGILLATAIVFPFSNFISMSIGQPYVAPEGLRILHMTVMTFLLVFTSCMAAAVYAAFRVLKEDTYEIMREGE